MPCCSWDCWGCHLTSDLMDQNMIRSHPIKAVDVVVCPTSWIDSGSRFINSGSALRNQSLGIVIQLLMQRLSLTEMVHGYESLAEQAAQKNLPYCDFLEQVLESEANPRQERNIKVRTQLAGFPHLKRLEQFDFKFPTSIDEKKIRELASLRFLERHENAVFLGPPGVGKTHLAVSLDRKSTRLNS